MTWPQWHLPIIFYHGEIAKKPLKNCIQGGKNSVRQKSQNFWNFGIKLFRRFYACSKKNPIYFRFKLELCSRYEPLKSRFSEGNEENPPLFNFISVSLYWINESFATKLSRNMIKRTVKGFFSNFFLFREILQKPSGPS